MSNHSMSVFSATAMLLLLVGLTTGCQNPNNAPTPDGEQSAQETGAEEAALSDAFHSERLADWQWVRENPEGHRMTPEGLEILIEPGGLMGGGKDAKNIYTRPLPQDANRVAVTVEHHPESQFEQAGLILYHDDDNYVKLVREFVDGATNIIFIIETEAAPELISSWPSEQAAERVGIQWQGNTLQAFVIEGEENGESIIGSGEFPMDPRPRAGVFAQSGQPDSDRWARFAGFTIQTAE